MQLIFMTDNTDIGIKEKMATLDHSASEKFDNTVIKKLKDDVVDESNPESTGSEEGNVEETESSKPFELSDIKNNELGKDEKLTNGEITSTINVSDKTKTTMNDTNASGDAESPADVIPGDSEKLISDEPCENKVKLIESVSDNECTKETTENADTSESPDNCSGNTKKHDEEYNSIEVDENVNVDFSVSLKINAEKCEQMEHSTELESSADKVEQIPETMKLESKYIISADAENYHKEDTISTNQNALHKIDEASSENGVMNNDMEEDSGDVIAPKQAGNEETLPGSDDKDSGDLIDVRKLENEKAVPSGDDVEKDSGDLIDAIAPEQLENEKAAPSGEAVTQHDKMETEDSENKETKVDENHSEIINDETVKSEPMALEPTVATDKSDVLAENLSENDVVMTDLLPENELKTETTSNTSEYLKTDTLSEGSLSSSDFHTATSSDEIIVGKEKGVEGLLKKTDEEVEDPKEKATEEVKEITNEDVVVGKEKAIEVQEKTDKEVVDAKEKVIGEVQEKINEEVVVAKEKAIEEVKEKTNEEVVVAKEKAIEEVQKKTDTNVVDAKEKVIEEVQEKTDRTVEDTKAEIHPQEPVTKETKAEVSFQKSSSKDEDKRDTFKLSNTLDILSDDEEENLKKINISDNSQNSQEKQTINLDDDDDIMLIDDDSSLNTDDKVRSSPEKISKTDEKMNLDTVDLDSKDPEVSQEPTEKKESTKAAEDDLTKPETDVPETNKLSEKTNIPKQVEPITTEKKKPLVPENFFKSYKKNLAEMTRDDLEEFCILKIVESIIDRSSLSETKAKLKSMAQSVEEFKKKAVTLIKQNRDLQVVLKSVQEEQKKNSSTPITPLKITRSVGMQVLLTDKNRRKTITAATPATSTNSNNNSANSFKQTKGNKVNRPQKAVQQIPVPRLVPASNLVKTPSQPSTINMNKSSPVTNGVKATPPAQKPTPPPQKPEKRTHSRMQSVTVDLTDDEPPAKVVTKSPVAQPPVRLVPSQNLLAARQTQGSSPRKVFIPISGAQNQIRPGQTIMVKNVPPGARARAPAPVRPAQSTPRLPRIQSRHPAPLPDAMKQYQPPNWRALPPAPDLKLSKVENGIVISWKIEGYDEGSYEEIASYQLFAYQETSLPPSTNLWKKIGDVKALPLPMACTLTQFMAGYKYYFAVRAVDIRSRLGPFSLPGSILLLNKM